MYKPAQINKKKFKQTNKNNQPNKVSRKIRKRDLKTFQKKPDIAQHGGTGRQRRARDIQGQPQQHGHSKLEASLGYKWPYFRKGKRRT